MSPYLDQPLVPLAVALPRMLEKIETELANENLEATERRLRQRAELIRGLLMPRPIVEPAAMESGVLARVGLLRCRGAGRQRRQVCIGPIIGC
jgi:hypothetical protein